MGHASGRVEAAAGERQERARVDDLDLDAEVREISRGLERDPAQRAVCHEGQIAPVADRLGYAERHRELPDVRRHALLEAVA